MEETIEIKELLLIFKKKICLILILGIISLIGSVIYSTKIVTPQFQTSVDLLVNSRVGEQITNADIQTSIHLIDTYSVIIQSSIVLERVRDSLDYELTLSQLRSMINARQHSESQILTIEVRGGDPELITSVANKTAEKFIDEVGSIMDVDNVGILSLAKTPENPFEPRLLFNMMIALLGGILAGSVLTIALEYLDSSIKTEEELEKLLEVPVLGVVPPMKRKYLRQK